MKNFIITISAIAVSFFGYQYWDGYSKASKYCSEGMNLIEYGITYVQLDSQFSKYAFKSKIDSCFDMNEIRNKINSLGNSGD